MMSKKYVLIILLYIAPRLAAMFVYSYEPSFDTAIWGRLSSGILYHQTLGFDGKPTAGGAPVYPVMLALLRLITFDSVTLTLILQVIITSLGAVYLYRLALLLSRDGALAWIATLLYCFYPYMVRQSFAIIEVPAFATMLIISAFYFCEAVNVSQTYKSGILCGISFGLTILTRFMSIPVFVLAILLLAVQKRFRLAAAVTVSMLIIVVPCFVRNYAVAGVLTSPRAGINLFVSNNKYSDQLIPWYSTDLMVPYGISVLEKERPDLINASPGDRDRFFAKKGWEFMLSDPVATVKFKLRNLFFLFYPRLVPYHPFSSSTEVITDGDKLVMKNVPKRPFIDDLIYSTTYGFILITSILGMFVRRKQLLRNDIFLMIIIFSFSAVYMMFWPAPRLRSPMDFVLIFYSAAFISRFLPGPRVSYKKGAATEDLR